MTLVLDHFDKRLRALGESFSKYESTSDDWVWEKIL